MQLIPGKIDSALTRSKYLVHSLKAIAHNAKNKSHAFKPKRIRSSNTSTFEGLQLIEYLLNQGNPKEAQKVFNKLKAQLESKNK